ncbi:class I histocompatibility antigen, F10 alpha chain-like isoform X2 [Dendropsophus ebraccatus]|uniref:class I histocompatibility antigen, F10 alpha chain-like isoform X2 n=1 Tax=Dendropsophus ebraccatus TaxID=150705 RepID=UPI0038316F3A
MFPLIVLLLPLSAVYADSHSLRYYTTGVSVPVYGMPEFSIAGYVDDKQIDLYTSDTRRYVPVADWVEKIEAVEHWEKDTQLGKEGEALFRHEVKIVMKRFNHSGGFHSVQVMVSCELNDDGSTMSCEQYRYDGEEYMFLDVQTGSYIPTMAEAQITTQNWNRQYLGRKARQTEYLRNECIKKLRRYIEHGREELERRVLPQVKVAGHISDEITTLHCLVYGFHPRAVDVKWVKNGIDDVPTDESTPVLPNPDGTYQIRVTAEVITKDGDSYSCYVDHSSLEEPLLVRWEPKTDSSVALILGGLILIPISIIVTVGVYRFKTLDKPRPVDSRLTTT